MESYMDGVRSFHKAFNFKSFGEALYAISVAEDGTLRVSDSLLAKISSTMLGFVLLKGTTMEQIGPTFCPVSDCENLNGCAHWCKHDDSTDREVSSGLDIIPVDEVSNCRVVFERALKAVFPSVNWDLEQRGMEAEALKHIRKLKPSVLKAENGLAFSIPEVSRTVTSVPRDITVFTPTGFYHLCHAARCFKRGIRFRFGYWYCDEHDIDSGRSSGKFNLLQPRIDLRRKLAFTLHGLYGNDASGSLPLTVWANLIRYHYLLGENGDLSIGLAFYCTSSQLKSNGVCIDVFCLLPAVCTESEIDIQKGGALDAHNLCQMHNNAISKKRIGGWIWKVLQGLEFGHYFDTGDYFDDYKKSYMLSNDDIMKLLNNDL